MDVSDNRREIWLERLALLGITVVVCTLLYLFAWGLSRERCWELPRNTTAGQAQEWERAGVRVFTNDDGTVEACEK